MKKLLALLLLVCLGGAFAAHQLGYAGRWVGAARVQVAPRDTSILGYFPAESRGLAVIQVPLVKVVGRANERLTDVLRDLEDTTGVRIAFDMDTIAFNDTIQVARGRFHWDTMKEKLEANRYQITNENGRPVAVRQDSGDTLCLDGEYLVHGRFEDVKAAIDRFAGGSGSSKKSQLATDLEAVGWGHSVLGVWRLTDDGSSVEEILKGKQSLRAIGASIDTQESGLLITILARAASASSAGDLAQQAEKLKRSAMEELAKSNDPDAARAKEIFASLVVQSEGPIVRARVEIPSDVIERAAERASDLSSKVNTAVLGTALGTLQTVLQTP